MDLEQVMGPPLGAKELKKMAPQFVFNGENGGQFLREFPIAADFFDVAEAFEWESDKELSGNEQRKNVQAMAVLRRYVTDDVLQVITTGKATRAAAMYRTLKQVFIPANARTKLHVQRELLGCDMRAGESLIAFLGRIKSLINEMIGLGENMDVRTIMITMTARLRPFLRNLAEEKMDREEDITLAELTSYLISKQKEEKELATSSEAAFVGMTGQREHNKGSQAGRGGMRGGGQVGRGT